MIKNKKLGEMKMFNKVLSENREENYKMMLGAITDLLESEKDGLVILSVLPSFINSFMDDINWVGFYKLRDDELSVGPFQGEPPCLRIKLGKGVCGAAAEQEKIIVVENVHDFPGHIACDSKTNSEIVLPIMSHDEVWGVLDIDSPILARFGELEKKYLQLIVEKLEVYLN